MGLSSDSDTPGDDDRLEDPERSGRQWSDQEAWSDPLGWFSRFEVGDPGTFVRPDEWATEETERSRRDDTVVQPSAIIIPERNPDQARDHAPVEPAAASAAPRPRRAVRRLVYGILGVSCIAAAVLTTIVIRSGAPTGRPPAAAPPIASYPVSPASPRTGSMPTGGPAVVEPSGDPSSSSAMSSSAMSSFGSGVPTVPGVAVSAAIDVARTTRGKSALAPGHLKP